MPNSKAKAPQFTSAVFVEDNGSARTKDGDDARVGTVVLATDEGEQVICKNISRKQFYKWKASGFEGDACPDNVRV